jgi:hypothetical protein
MKMFVRLLMEFVQKAGFILAGQTGYFLKLNLYPCATSA